MTTTVIDECTDLTEAQFKMLQQARTRASPKERAMLFADDMVRALIAGTKTQTRRAVANARRVAVEHCRFGIAGDRIWVRECWAQPDPTSTDVVYRADLPEELLEVERDIRRECGPGSYASWRPSIHMPRWASRITLEITEVRLQRLWEMSHGDIAAEGVEACDAQMSAPHRFKVIWDANHHGRLGCQWNDNPLVWAITFRRVP